MGKRFGRLSVVTDLWHREEGDGTLDQDTEINEDFGVTETSPRQPGLDTSLTLLRRATGGDDNAWQTLVSLYQPLIRGWFERSKISNREVEDLTQDVLAHVVKNLPRFDYSGRSGSFRCWLRTITINRAREFWRAGKCRPSASGGSAFFEMVEQLADPRSELSQKWDQDHDDHVLCRLLEMIAQQFEPQSVLAFRLVVLEKADVAAVAAQLNMTVPAVYAAKSRILRRLREEAEGLID